MGDAIRTYLVRGTSERALGGEATLHVKAFTAEDALVQVKLEHEHFKPRSIEPISPDDWRLKLAQQKGLEG